MWFPNRSDTNQPVKSQKQASGLKFWFQEEGLYYLYRENKGAEQLRSKLICAFIFAFADCWYSQEAAHMFIISLTL